MKYGKMVSTGNMRGRGHLNPFVAKIILDIDSAIFFIK